MQYNFFSYYIRSYKQQIKLKQKLILIKWGVDTNYGFNLITCSAHVEVQAD